MPPTIFQFSLQTWIGNLHNQIPLQANYAKLSTTNYSYISIQTKILERADIEMEI